MNHITDARYMYVIFLDQSFIFVPFPVVSCFLSGSRVDYLLGTPIVSMKHYSVPDILYRCSSMHSIFHVHNTDLLEINTVTMTVS